jgi:SAM-dependent methyltransferase
MSESHPSFDPVWEEIYHQGRQVNRYPFDQIVAFVNRHQPKEKPRSETRVLEVGCGAGNNLWFAAREGFQVAGIDGSQSAIDYARTRFRSDGLSGDLRVGDFVTLPWQDGSFDFVLDRAALTNCGLADVRRAIAEIRRVLRTGGKFFFNPYAQSHSSCASGHLGPDGLTLDITSGGLQGMGPICFHSRRDIDQVFEVGWRLHAITLVERTDVLRPGYNVMADWQVIAEKVG